MTVALALVLAAGQRQARPADSGWIWLSAATLTVMNGVVLVALSLRAWGPAGAEGALFWGVLSGYLLVSPVCYGLAIYSWLRQVARPRQLAGS